MHTGAPLTALSSEGPAPWPIRLTLNNGLQSGDFCPNHITGLVLEGMRMTAPDGSFVSAGPLPMFIDFGSIIEGNAPTGTLCRRLPSVNALRFAPALRSKASAAASPARR